jgi:alkylation response protein AidB-like acyl-CoA dehydrogenase
MRFDFTAEQLQFRDSVRGLLARECAPQHVRAVAATETGRSPERWRRLAEIGLVGILAPEAHGGLGLDEVDGVLAFEETGRCVLPEPVVETVAVAVPLVRDAGVPALAARWLPAVAAGDAIVTVGHQSNPLVADAHVADLLLLEHGGELHAIERAQVGLAPVPVNDPARRLFRVTWTPRDATRIARGAVAAGLLADALDRGALATAAQLVGIGQQLVDVAAGYATERQQFGRPIGSFQAVKHLLATVQVRLEFARPAVYRAAFSVARGTTARAIDVSHAKVAAADAALAAARAALQVHGAIGYTWEVDLHLWMKRAWALEAAWGSRGWHRRRVAAAVLDGAGRAPTFGYDTPV